jgi:hypothetical protein
MVQDKVERHGAEQSSRADQGKRIVEYTDRGDSREMSCCSTHSRLRAVIANTRGQQQSGRKGGR